MKVVIIGAGMAGLMAARSLQQAGHVVVVFDKGRSPGGRLATRRIGEARFDHGAQFFTVRSDAFARQVEPWRRDDIVFEWCRGFAAPADGCPRYAVREGMTTLTRHLARGLDVRCNAMVHSLHRGPHGHGAWQVTLDDRSVQAADALIVTCPVPQAVPLLHAADVPVPDALCHTAYDRTLCLLAVCDRPPAVPEPGGVQGAPGFTFIADNVRKGISTAHAVTLHADPAWSDAHWDEPDDAVHHHLLDAARPWLGAAQVVESQVKRWRFATPRAIWSEPAWRPPGIGSIILAGDAFAGPRVEGAALSGLAAAALVMDA